MDSKCSVCFLWKVMLLLIVVTSRLWEVSFHDHLKVLWSSSFFVISTTLHRSFHLYDNEIQCRFVLLLTKNDICKLLSIINTVNFYRTQTENRKYALALAFSMYEINRNPDLLPNMSLIFKFSAENCVWENKLMSLMHSSLQNYDILPNYLCEEYTECVMALTSLNWATTVTLYTILNNFMSEQVNFYFCVSVCFLLGGGAGWEFTHEIMYL